MKILKTQFLRQFWNIKTTLVSLWKMYFKMILFKSFYQTNLIYLESYCRVPLTFFHRRCTRQYFFSLRCKLIYEREVYNFCNPLLNSFLISVALFLRINLLCTFFAHEKENDYGQRCSIRYILVASSFLLSFSLSTTTHTISFN